MDEHAGGRAVVGFVYVDERAPDCLKGADAGARVTLPSFEPPWIVVDHALESVIVARWPGRLFRVEVVPPATAEGRAVMARAARELSSGARYTRALAVDLLEELSPSVLFGPYGESVTRVIEAGLALDEDGAGRLAAARRPAADRAYGAAWKRWLTGRPPVAPCQGQDHAWPLAIPGAGGAGSGSGSGKGSGAGPGPGSGAGPGSGSPIGAGFSVVYRALCESARLRGRPGALTVDEDGEQVLADPWRPALGALLDAAMAFGAPQLLAAEAAATLATAWNVAFESGCESSGSESGDRSGGHDDPS